MFKALSAMFKLFFGFFTITGEEALPIYSDALKTTKVWTGVGLSLSQTEAKLMQDIAEVEAKAELKAVKSKA